MTDTEAFKTYGGMDNISVQDKMAEPVKFACIEVFDDTIAWINYPLKYDPKDF